MAKADADHDSVAKSLKDIKQKYNLTSIELVKDSEDPTSETDHVLVVINPQKTTKPKKFVKGMPERKVYFEHGSYDAGEYKRQLVMQQKTIWGMKVYKWMENRAAFVARRDAPGSKSGRDKDSAKLQREHREGAELSWITNRTAELLKGISKPTAADQTAALKKAKNDWKDQAALHPLDQVAGGGPKPTDMGDTYVNSSIGSTWRTQIDDIYKTCEAISPSAQHKANMNVTIHMDGSPV